MPQFCEDFEKHLYVFTFPTYIVRYRQKAFYRLKTTFTGNVSFNYVNPSFVHFSGHNSGFDFEIGSARKHFQKHPKNVLNNNQYRSYSL